MRRIQAADGVTDAQRAAMGITLRDVAGKPESAGRLGRPLIRVDTSQRLQHAIGFVDEATPTRRAWPPLSW